MQTAGVGSLFWPEDSVQLPNTEHPLFRDAEVHHWFSHDQHGPLYVPKEADIPNTQTMHLFMYTLTCFPHPAHSHDITTHCATLPYPNYPNRSIRSLSSYYLKTFPVWVTQTLYFYIFSCFFFNDSFSPPLRRYCFSVHSMCNRGPLLYLKHKTNSLTPQDDLCTPN